MWARRLAGSILGLLIASAASAAVTPSPRAPVAGAAATPDVEKPQLVVSGEKQTRTVDCDGARAMVAANDGSVTLKRCVQIVIAGSHEHVTAQLTPDSSILVLGDHDVVRWQAAPGYSPVVRDQGRGNTMAPL